MSLYIIDLLLASIIGLRNNAPNSCFRSSIGDTLSAIDILALFIESCLREAPQSLAVHVSFFLLLNRIVSIYRLNDGCLPAIDIVVGLNDLYIDQFRELYPECETPKLHVACLHIPERARRKMKLSNTLSGERYHRKVKAHAVWAFGLRPELSYTRRCVAEFLDHVSTHNGFASPFHMLGGRAMRNPNGLQWARLELGLEEPVEIGNGLQTPSGTYKKGNMIVSTCGSVGEIKFICQGTLLVLGGAMRVKVVVELWAAADANVRALYKSTGSYRVADPPQIQEKISYISLRAGRLLKLPQHTLGPDVLLALGHAPAV